MEPSAVRMLASFALVIGVIWFAVSLLRAAVPRWRASAWLGMKRAAVLFVVALLGPIAFNQFVERNASTPSPAVSIAAVEAESSEDDAAPTVEIAAAPPIPTARPADAPAEQPAKRELLPTQEARLMCRAIDESGLGSAPCSYSGWNSTITMTIDTTASEARVFCQAMAKYSRDNKMGLNGWRLEIRSPYSGNNSIAFCMLA